MNGYICLWKGQRVEVYAETSLRARDKAVGLFQAKSRAKVKPSDVTAVLAEKNGEPVVHTADF